MTPKDFQSHCELSLKTFTEKNAQYGDAVEETGLLGATIELIGCVARLRKLVLEVGGVPESEEDKRAIANALEDAHNYANIGIQMLYTKNWRGRYSDPIELAKQMIADSLLKAVGLVPDKEFEKTIDNVPLNQ